MSRFFSSISATYNTDLINYVEFLYQIIEKSRRTQQSTSFGKAEKPWQEIGENKNQFDDGTANKIYIQASKKILLAYLIP